MELPGVDAHPEDRPALAAGCTIVLKPAEQTPLLAVEVFKLLEEVGLPEGVVNLVTTNDPETVGPELVTHPKVRKITFTGSTEVGKLIAQQAAAGVKRVSMELGGHAPFLVFDDADPVHAAKGAAAVKFLNTGQACICPNRMLVQRGIAEEFVATMESRFNGLKAGSGFTDGVTVGPLIDDAALAKMERQVADALDKGATLVTGGERLTADGLDAGSFYAPTLLADVTPDMLIYREETFGPVAPVIVFDDDDEAIAMANDTDYGLASYVYTQVADPRVPGHGAAEVRHGRRQRHQPDVGRRPVRRREAERPRRRGRPRGHRRVPRHQARRPLHLTPPPPRGCVARRSWT